jgi:hypothetical protein
MLNHMYIVENAESKIRHYHTTTSSKYNLHIQMRKPNDHLNRKQRNKKCGCKVNIPQSLYVIVSVFDPDIDNCSSLLAFLPNFLFLSLDRSQRMIVFHFYNVTNRLYKLNCKKSK